MGRLATYGRNISFSSSGSSGSPRESGSPRGSSGPSLPMFNEDYSLITELSHVLTMEELKQLAEQLGHVSSKEKRTALLRKTFDEHFMTDAKSTAIEMNPQSHSHSANLLGKAIEGEYRYAMLGIILGLATIIGGIILGLHGVAGSTSWTAKLLGLESKISDAAPGVVLFVVGMFFVFLTRPKVKLDNLKG